MEFKQWSVQTPSMISSPKQASIIFPRDQHAWLQLKVIITTQGAQPMFMLQFGCDSLVEWSMSTHLSAAYICYGIFIANGCWAADLNSKVQFPYPLVLLLVCIPEAHRRNGSVGDEKNVPSALDIRVPYFIAFHRGWCTNLEVHTQIWRSIQDRSTAFWYFIYQL